MFDVFVNDSGSPSYDGTRDYYAGIAQWAKDNCKSFMGYAVQEVSDVSHLYDYIAVYHFEKQKDANWFTLRWKNGNKTQ